MRRLLPLLFIFACSDDSNSNRELLHAQLRKCELLSSEGRYMDNLAAEFGDETSCARGCLANASCPDLEQVLCGRWILGGQVSDWLLRCFRDCSPDGFECLDRSDPQAYRCNGFADCKDGSDEANCPASAFFVCPTGKRVPKDSQCDGTNDCPGGADEASCEALGLGFRCQNGKFIPGDNVDCDGHADCADGSDEAVCVSRGTAIACGDGSTIPTWRMCDGAIDCTNGSDERNCAQLYCSD